MDIFKLHSKVITDYYSYLKSFLKIYDPRIQDKVNEELSKGYLWPESILQLNPAYQYGSTIKELCENNTIHPACEEFFGSKLRLYSHQETAIQIAQKKQNYVLTTGTGSGKSLTYLIPIIDNVLRNEPEKHSVRSIIVYPMNALINSQYTALENFRNGNDFPVKFAKYTGQEKNELKLKIQEEKPHIILTNYVMLELMLLRPKENVFVDAFLSNIEYLVLDELHIYRGRQGADISYLIRRLKERSGNKDIICIGTSATMAVGDDRQKKKEAVATVAKKLFGSEFSPNNVIDENLVRKSTRKIFDFNEITNELSNSLDNNVKLEVFLNSPLVTWIEEFFGLEEKDGYIFKKKPKTLKEGIDELHNKTNISKEKCEEVLKKYLEIGSRLKTKDNNTVFPFKVHQFISQGGTVYATLESINNRHLTLEGQVYFGDKVDKKYLYPISFCRECGQEYYLVDFHEKEEEFLPKSPFYFDVDMKYQKEGYILVDEIGIWDESQEENLPDNWFNANGKIEKNFKEYIPKRLNVDAQGKIVDNNISSNSVNVWFLKSPFLTCLRCGVAYTRHAKNDYRKLSRLSSEGRSSATTLLSVSTLDYMQNRKDLDIKSRKVLSFTDNRQDASLQAGHFNDFIQVSILRAAIYNSLTNNSSLDYTNIAAKVFESLNLPFKDYSLAELNDEEKIKVVNNILIELIEYRIYEDLRRGWRVNQPNLEQCGLLKIEYDGLNRICSDESKWINIELLKQCSPDEREYIITSFLNHLRKNLAIDTDILDERKQQILKKRVKEHINEKWGFDEYEMLFQSSRFVLDSSSNLDRRKDLSLSERSGLGRFLRKERLWKGRTEKLSKEEYNNLLKDFLPLLEGFGFIVIKKDNKREYIQLRNSSIVWVKGDGEPPEPDPIRSNYFETKHSDDIFKESNTYFSEFYSDTATKLKLLQAKEHTGQIANHKRENIENRFREGEISALFCSPTMELGIDIADLNIVHLRNIPPNPANYAQRSGRSGRSGQPSLVLSYAGYGSSHDQYFFKRQDLMVSGNVVPQKFDITNEELVKAHLHSIWLAKTGVDLLDSIIEVLDVSDSSNNYPILGNINAQLRLSPNKTKDCLESFKSVLADNYAELMQTTWFTEEWLNNLLTTVLKDFDLTFYRWREMYNIAVKQRNDARLIQDNPRIARSDPKKVKIAEKKEAEAKNQISLLFNDKNSNSESDFYPYRYLASEGFLPGYNFPKLPIRAFIQTKFGDGEYISRPRFLAINEYGPRNVVYHEGKKFRIVKSYIPSDKTDDLFHYVKICKQCGYIHEGEQKDYDICENCKTDLNGQTSTVYTKMFRMTDVSTFQVEKITSDEEERLREGYVITTHYKFPPDTNESKKVKATVINNAEKPIIDLTFINSTQLYKINHGFRRNDGSGFALDISNGIWSKNDDQDNAETIGDKVEHIHKQISIFVNDTKNIILLHPLNSKLLTEEILGSFEYAFLRGIQEFFQVEEQELASERIGIESNRRILIYEASEGGLGILNRLLKEPNVIQEIAKRALEIIHYSVDDKGNLIDNDQDCVQACYECLLSYSNQRDHKLLNRHLIADILFEMTSGRTLQGSATRDYDQHYLYLKSITDSRSELERKFLGHLYKTKRKLPDSAQNNLEDYYSCPDFYYNDGKVCVYCDGSIHDSTEQRTNDDKVRKELKQMGYRVIVIRYDEDLETQISKYPGIFGGSNE